MYLNANCAGQISTVEFSNASKERRFNKYQARFKGEHRGISHRRPPACTFPLKYKIISTDISPQCSNARSQKPISREVEEEEGGVMFGD